MPNLKKGPQPLEAIFFALYIYIYIRKWSFVVFSRKRSTQPFTEVPGIIVGQGPQCKAKEDM